ncbi:MAG: hypothetical protein Q8Q09_22880 [Deltaproteobacteria bacterium]|nr:hypothetical protein [Deltaproteobacteria bacterium]
MNLSETLGLPATFCASTFNPKFSRKNDWLADRQKDVDYFAKVSVAGCCWITAGLLSVVGARLETLAPAMDCRGSYNKRSAFVARWRPRRVGREPRTVV